MACIRCGGTGILMQYIKVDGGKCFRCNGSGVDPREINLIREEKIHREKVINGKKVVLTTKRDLTGRFIGYNIYIEGMLNQGVVCKNIKEANTAFKAFKQQARAMR